MNPRWRERESVWENLVSEKTAKGKKFEKESSIMKQAFLPSEKISFVSLSSLFSLSYPLTSIFVF